MVVEVVVRDGNAAHVFCDEHAQARSTQIVEDMGSI
ncbi:MAG: hypothetical protein ACI8RZ_007502, partial [Myxococcota bacterium]